MKTTRKLLTLLLALMLMVSAFAVTAYAEEEMDTSPYLCFSWLDNSGDGWYENTDRDWYNDNRGFSTVPQQDHWQVYYYAVWNGTDWEYTAIDPSNLVVENLTVTPLRDMPEESTMGTNSHCFCRVQAIDWGNASIRYTMDDGTVLTMNVEVRRNEDGFYNSQTLNNNTYITEYRVNPFAEESYFYFGFQSTFWKLKDAQLVDVGAERATMEKVRNNLYKITLDPDYVRNCWNLDPFRLEVDITVYNDDDPENYWEENWRPGIDCNPIWSHEMEQLAMLRINGSEYTLVEDGWVRGYEEQMENEDGDTWYEWRTEIADLPEGVSYDYNTNTLTLQNAKLTKLELLYSWYDQENNNSGTFFPNENLTINLIGENTILNDIDWAVGLGDEIKATITGSGSLHVKATNHNQQNEWGYYSYPAFAVDSGADLTIGGNAKVTVEIAGEALSGSEEEHHPAHLIALHCNDRNLTLCDNAVLTTVVPDGAMSSGSYAPNPDDPWNFPGGYAGIGTGATLTIKDNATLNTTTLNFTDIWNWDEEKQEDYLVGGSSFIMEGGTLNLTALADKSITEKWEWDEEKEEDVFLGYSDWYHCRAMGLFSSLGQHKISGGTINILAEPTQVQHETGAHSAGFEVESGTLDITGGTININMPKIGTGLAAGGWEENQNGTVTMTGGEINMTGLDSGLEVNPFGVMHLNGGKIHIENGGVALRDKREWNEETETEDILSTGTLTIDGTEVTIDQGVVYSSGNLTINSGCLDIKYARGTNMDAEEWIILYDNDGTLIVNGGELTLDGTDVNITLNIGNSFRQTGGIVNLNVTVSDAWKEEIVNRYEGNVNWEPMPYAAEVYGSMTIDGGSMNLKGFRGMVGYTGSSFTLNDGELNINATVLGLATLGGEITLNDGSLSIDVSGRSGDFIIETGEIRSLKQGDALVVETGEGIPGKLTVNGGDHVLNCVQNEGVYSISSGILSYLSEVTINGGSLMVRADAALIVNKEADPEVFITFAENMQILSLVDGHALQLLEYSYHPVLLDEDHNPVLDENGDYVRDESVTHYQYWLEEDNIVSADDEIADYSKLIVITSKNCGENAAWNYDVDSKTLTVTGEGTMYDYTGEPATGISPWYWFKENELIKTVVLEDGITSIGDYAFFDQGAIESTIGMQVVSVGEKAFDTDAKLTAVCTSAAAEYASANGLNATVIHQYVNGKCSRCGDKQESPFADVPAGAFYFDPVRWAVENRVTTGATEDTFDPNGSCLRAHVVTFLHRAEGNPEPKKTTSPFTDVASGSFFYKPVLWAVEESITNGTSATTFGSYDNCNRAAVVTFLWRAAGSPEPESTDNPFVDVATTSYYYKAVLWAVENGITNGLDATHFGPTSHCNRAQVVTFLYRAKN